MWDTDRVNKGFSQVENFSVKGININQKDSEESLEFNMVGDRGVEPLTSTTSMWRSSQLS